MAKEQFEIPLSGIGLAYGILKRVLCQMEPHGQSPWYLGQRHVRRHPGHTMAHSSTAKGRACTQECLRSTKHSVQPGVSARRRGLLLPE